MIIYENDTLKAFYGQLNELEKQLDDVVDPSNDRVLT